MLIPLLLRDDRKRQAWEKQRKGWEGGKEEDKGMLALRGGTCCWRRSDMGGRGAVGGVRK